MAKSAINLAFARRHMGQFEEAELLAREAAAMLETKVGPDHIATGAALAEQAAALRGLKRTKEAKQLAKRATAILEKNAKDHQIGEVLDISLPSSTEKR